MISQVTVVVMTVIVSAQANIIELYWNSTNQL